ncbi:MAG: hypothetical protein HY813_01805 [Candidatus Portnoybacteria bacterium]|nr:hypothetical protein [Candidatus Portnoybacteria bacterium]
MLILNLLPPEEKESLRLDKMSRAAIFWGRLFLFLTCIFAALLTAIWLYLSVQVRAMEKLVDVEKGGNSLRVARELETEVAVINQKMRFLDDLQNRQVSVVDALENLAKAVPPGVSFDNFAFNAKDNKIILTGHALTREQLIVFRRALDRCPSFFGIESPVSNFVKPEDIDFNLSFVIK